MKRKFKIQLSAIVALSISLTLSVTVNAEQKNRNVDEVRKMAGTWILEPNSSFIGDQNMRGFKNYILVVNFTESEMTIKTDYDFGTEHISRNYLFYLDGRGETNSQLIPRTTTTVEFKSKTTVNGSKIIRRYKQPLPIGQLYMDATEEYRLSKDADKLVIDTVFVSQAPTPSGNSRYLRVFRRKT
jgi:hypothetical protein